MSEGSIGIALNAIHPDQEKDIDNRFDYHAPWGDLAVRYNTIRTSLRDLAKGIIRLTPKGREQALALTYLEQVMFWANAGIARNMKKPPIPHTIESVTDVGAQAPAASV